MSKLTTVIETAQTGKVKVVPASFAPITDVTEEHMRVDFGAKMEYRLGVTMHVKGYADPNNGAEIAQMKAMCKRQLIHETFGEFLPHLRKIERLLYDLDFDAARVALMELENEMFT